MKTRKKSRRVCKVGIGKARLKRETRNWRQNRKQNGKDGNTGRTKHDKTGTMDEKDRHQEKVDKTGLDKTTIDPNSYETIQFEWS